MKIDLNATLTDLFGNVLKDGEAPVTLRNIIQNALIGQLRGDENLTGAEKFSLYNLAAKTTEAASDFSIEDLATIKDRVGRAYSQVVIGPAFKLLEAAQPPAD